MLEVAKFLMLAGGAACIAGITMPTHALDFFPLCQLYTMIITTTLAFMVIGFAIYVNLTLFDKSARESIRDLYYRRKISRLAYMNIGMGIFSKIILTIGALFSVYYFFQTIHYSNEVRDALHVEWVSRMQEINELSGRPAVRNAE